MTQIDTVLYTGKTRVGITRRYFGNTFNGKRRYFAELPPEERRRYYQELVSDVAQSAQPIGDLATKFDSYPGLKIILGHLGEGLPFYLWRISMGLARDGRGGKSFRDAFCEHFYITTSGFFSDPALLCCVMEMGIDRILFSVDYPFVENAPGTEWLNRIPLCAEDKAKIMSGNAKRLLKM